MPIVTPGGKYLGRIKDAEDPNDRTFLAAHPAARDVPLPPSVDLRSKLPPVFDQGNLGSCGLNMGDAMMCFLFPEIVAATAPNDPVGFSRLQTYYDVRVMEGSSPNEDSGVQTRDVFKTLAQTGAAPEVFWPYDIGKFTQQPPPEVYTEAAKYKIGSYSRLISASNYLQCLASGFPFGMGIELYESFEGDQINRTGIMPPPGPDEKVIGGHDVTAVGYILNFKSDPLFTKSGLDPALVSDEMLMVRNSWSAKWSHQYRGHFFMPLEYAMSTATGNDAWTGRRAA